MRRYKKDPRHGTVAWSFDELPVSVAEVLRAAEEAFPEKNLTELQLETAEYGDAIALGEKEAS